MGTKPQKPRAMRSRRSGVKSLNIIKKNLEILKKKQSHYEANLALITKKMREIIYKYDTAKMDYTSRAKKG